MNNHPCPKQHSCTIHIPAPNNNLTTIHTQSVFMEAMGSRTTCQGTREKLTHLCIGNRHRDLDLSVDPVVAHESALAPLNQGMGNSKEHCLKQLPADERIFVEVQVSSGEEPEHH